MDITPHINKEKNIIQRYGANYVVISDTRYDGSVLVTPEKIYPWNINDINTLTAADFSQLPTTIECCLLGCGPNHLPLPPTLHALPFAIDIMTTDAACRTYNVLLAEGRQVAAALIIA